MFQLSWVVSKPFNEKLSDPLYILCCDYLSLTVLNVLETDSSLHKPYPTLRPMLGSVIPSFSIP